MRMQRNFGGVASGGRYLCMAGICGVAIFSGVLTCFSV